jgi:hypothetical protein
MQHARLDLHLVLANLRVLFGLMMMRHSCVDDGTTELMLVIARLGVTVDR